MVINTDLGYLDAFLRKSIFVFPFFKGYRGPSLKGTAIAVKSCKV